MENPLVSIVLPTYNCEEYLGQAIDSILAQTYTNWELIIVDDASTDGTAQLLQTYNDPRIRITRNIRNEQTYFSCNIGISLCRGNYIASQDSDDLWLPDKLEKQVAWLEMHPDCTACFTIADIIDENGKNINKGRPELYKQYSPENRPRECWLHDLLLHDNCLCHTSVVFRRRVITDTGTYNIALLQLSDYELWLRILLCGNIWVLQEKLTQCRRPYISNSISTPSKTVLKRDGIEKCTVISDIIDRMDNDLFLRAFADELRNPNAMGHIAARCEKAFLKLDHFIYDPIRLSGCQDLIRLFSEKESANMLRESYCFSQKDFYAYISQNTFPEARVPYIIEIFWDFGSGFSINNVNRFLLGEKALSALDLIVDVPDGAAALRFDPVPDEGCIVSRLCMSCNGQMLTLHSTNGCDFEEVYCFDNADPQFIFALPEGIGRHLHITAAISVSSELCNLFDQLENENTQLQTENTQLQTENAQLQTENSQLQMENSQLQMENSQLQTENSQLQTKNTQLQTDNSQLQTDISQLQTENDNQRTFINELQLSSEQQQNCNNLLEQELAVVKAEIERLSHDYDVISNSDFWKITKPLRTCLDFLKHTALGNLLYRFARRLKHRGVEATTAGIKLFQHLRKNGREIVLRTPFIKLISRDVSNSDVLSALDEDFVRLSEQKKIIFFSHELTLTGAPLVLLNFAKEAKKQGYYAVIISPVDGPLRAEAEKVGILVVVIPGLLQKNYLYDLCYPFNLVVACTIVSAPVIKALDGRDIPVIWWIHEALASYHEGAVIELPASLSNNIHVYCVCDYSEKCLKTYRNYHLDGLLPYYMEEFNSKLNINNFSLPGIEGKLVFAMVGTMEHRKGHDILAAAIRKLPDDIREKCMFVIVSKNFYQPFKLIIDELCQDFPENVLYYEQLGREDMGVLYKICDCLICSSRDDPLPCVITEALSLGKPVISSEHTGYSSILREMGSGILYADDNPSKLSDCIVHFVSEPALRHDLSLHTRETYEKHFSVEVFEKNVGYILNRLVYRLSDEELKVENGIENIPFKKTCASVSVIIPIWKPGEGFENLLNALENQQGLQKLEIVIIDSGSDEKTIEICEKHGVNLIQIPHTEFSHSGTRNLGAQKASGDILLFMTQDAFPTSKRWIARLIAPILSGIAAAASPIEECPDGTDLYYRVASNLHIDFLGIAKKDRINTGIGSGDRSMYRRRAALNDVTTVVSRQVFLRFGYRYNFAEDLDLGIRLLRGGYSICFLNSVHTLHGHNRDAGYYLKRSLVDTISTNQDILGTPIEGTASSMDICGMLIQGLGSFCRLYKKMLQYCTSSFDIFTTELECYFTFLLSIPAKEAADVAMIEETETDPVLLSAAHLMRDCAGEQFAPRYEVISALKGYYISILKPFLQKLEWNNEIAFAALDCLEKQLAAIIGCELARVGRDDPFYPMLDEFKKGI